MKKHKDKTTNVQNQDNSEYSGKEELRDLEEGLENYNKDIVFKIAKGLGITEKSNITEGFAEFGAGTGALAEIWRDKFHINPICIEIDSSLIQILKTKSFTTYENLSSIYNSLSFVYTSNVLEHIEDDLSALKDIKKKIKPGGSLAIYVPALPFLYTDMDKKVGHYRRYTRSELVKKVSSAGFTVQESFYNDSLGVLATLIVKVLGYKNKAGLGSQKSIILYDKVVYPISKILDRLIFRKVIGKNLFLFAVND
jgi:SAM-dependent methyltransferase